MGYKGYSDFRSDTVTRPTKEMLDAMYNAEVGDDVLGDDPTVKELEELAAEMLGMESALFVPSGTMANTIAMKLAVGEGKVVIMEENCHIFNFEAGNVSRIAGSIPRILPSINGEIPLDLIEKYLNPSLREHIPQLKAITLENTHNTWGGTVLSIEYIKQVHTLAKHHNLHLHLDGARVFNAAIALAVEVREIARYFDSLMFCLSKGLCAPIGSILAGRKDFIKEARFVRKYLGGGMRQVGIIAAAGIVSLKKMVPRLADDHLRTKTLAKQIADLDEVAMNLDNIVTNFIMLKLKKINSDLFLKKLAQQNVLALPFSPEQVRFVIHKDIDDHDIARAASAIRGIFS